MIANEWGPLAILAGVGVVALVLLIAGRRYVDRMLLVRETAVDPEKPIIAPAPLTGGRENG